MTGLAPKISRFHRESRVYKAVEICYKIPGWQARLPKPPEASRTVVRRVTQRRTPMKIIQPSAVPAEPATSPLFTGEVSRQPILTPEMSQNFNLGIVNFPAGVRNKMHTHSSDQVLFVTAGKGIIATETEEQEITVGDIVHITADEKHWHGATPDSAFSHIALTAKGSTTTQVEP